MASVKLNTTIKGYQEFVQEVYGLPNDRYFGKGEMITNIERFAMRALKGIRKGDKEKTRINLIISLSWFISLMNRFHINLEDEIWKRFPYLCSYCGSCPCSCKEKKIKKRQKVFIDNSKHPKTLKEFQTMFSKIYPPQKRTLEHAGVHLAEELGELSEVLMRYHGTHEDEDFKKVPQEAADLFSCLMGVFNSLKIDVAKELSKMFSKNCHICKEAPCECNFVNIAKFKS